MVSLYNRATPAQKMALRIVEGAIKIPGALFIASDISAHCITRAHENVLAAGKDVFARIEVLVANALLLPFADATFTAVVSDLPFGRMDRSIRDNLPALYAGVLAELGRVVVVGGRAALLVEQLSLLAAAVDSWWVLFPFLYFWVFPDFWVFCIFIFLGMGSNRILTLTPLPGTPTPLPGTPNPNPHRYSNIPLIK